MSVKIPADIEGYVPNPYEKEQQEALAYLKREADSTDGWSNIGSGSAGEFTKQKKSFEGDTSSIPLVRGKGIFPNSTVKEFLPLVTHPGARAHWDARFAEGHALERYTRRAYKFYTIQKGAFLVSPRDFVGTQIATFEGPDDEPTTAWLAQTTVPNNDDTPDVKGKVRGTLTLSGWQIKQAGSDVELTYMVKVNPNGSVPPSLVSVVVQEIPSCVPNVVEWANKFGLIPYVIEPKPESVFRMESYDHAKKAQYTLQLIAKGGETINLWVDKDGKYKNGYTVTVEGDGKAGVELDQQPGNLKITFTPDADGKKVDIVVAQK